MLRYVRACDFPLYRPSRLPDLFFIPRSWCLFSERSVHRTRKCASECCTVTWHLVFLRHESTYPRRDIVKTIFHWQILGPYCGQLSDHSLLVSCYICRTQVEVLWCECSRRLTAAGWSQWCLKGWDHFSVGCRVGQGEGCLLWQYGSVFPVWLRVSISEPSLSVTTLEAAKH